MNGRKTVAELGYIVMVLFETEANHLFRFMDNHFAAHLEDMKNRYSDVVMEKLQGVHQL